MRAFFTIGIFLIASALCAQQPINNKGNRNQTYPEVTVVNPQIAALVAQVDMENLESSIRWMQQYIRDACNEEALITQNWLIDQFEDFGLEVYAHYFTSGYCSSGPNKDTLDAGNVVAIQWGTEFPEEYIIVSSHYDHPSGPGADDNASGTAGVLEIARILSQHELKRTILYVPFNAEEQWMVGSLPFAEKCATENMNLLGVFNLDMIGFFPEDMGPLTMCSGACKISERLYQYYEDVANLYVPEIPTFQLTAGDSYGGDHMPFNIYEYPALYIGDIEYHIGYNPCYHQPCDTLGHGVNSLPLAQGFVRATLAAVAELANGWLPPQNLRAVPSETAITVSWDAAPETASYKVFKNNIFLAETEETSFIDDTEIGVENTYYVKGVHADTGEESPASNRDYAMISSPLTLPYFNGFEENTNGIRLCPEWELTTSEHYSGNTSLTTGDIFQNHFSTAELRWFSIPDTVANISLSFYVKGTFNGTWHATNVFIEASTDRRSWDKLLKISKPGFGSVWQYRQVPLNQYIGENFVQIRIRVESSGEHYTNPVGKLYFDDIKLDYSAPSIPIPENLRITSYSGNIARLAWNQVTTMYVTHYNVYKNGTQIGTAIGINYTDDSASPEDCYHVTAVYNSDIESDFSNEACVKDVGIKENIPFSGIKIIPNPSDGKISIETGLPTACHLAIFTVQGVKVFEKESFNDGMLDLSNFPKGVYILKISTKDESVAKKIVVR